MCVLLCVSALSFSLNFILFYVRLSHLIEKKDWLRLIDTQFLRLCRLYWKQYFRNRIYIFLMYTLADANADPRQCTPGDGTCHVDATCTQVTPYVCDCNPASSYRCECNQGYTGDGLTCSGEQWTRYQFKHLVITSLWLFDYSTQNKDFL